MKSNYDINLRPRRAGSGLNMALFVWVLFLILASCSSRTAPPCKVSPEIFCSRYKSSWSEIPPKVRLEMMHSQTLSSNYDLGLYVRNRYDLWGDNDITRFFKSHNVKNPELMSIIFLYGFRDYLDGRTVNMDLLIKRVYMKISSPPPPITRPGK